MNKKLARYKKVTWSFKNSLEYQKINVPDKQIATTVMLFSFIATTMFFIPSDKSVVASEIKQRQLLIQANDGYEGAGPTYKMF